ncbi:dienelactone hydrolase family protein [Flavobacterium sp.]|uniref:dienelactone hydrolase family protein n=1 Tax=Flavobacterium sp. TaxID=239 RepID=UPI0011FA2727|nr:dienelactone hydrolase family protein [Flavobacterium sp.]RZJ72163.1 MAG: dienelactone hydrolase family protein [Flavobacterium sp.]
MKKIALAVALVLTTATFAQLKTVAYSDGSQKLNGMAIAPAKQSAKKPGILILPAWMGIQAHEKEVAEKLSKMGYSVLIADIYGEGNYPKTPDEAGKMSGKFKTDYALYQKRIQLALDQLVKQGASADNIVAIGYCFGGTGVLEMARSNMKVKGVVSFHGGLAKDKSRKNELISTKVLVLHGADDKFVGNIDDFQNEMRDGKADWQMNYYADAVHAFTEKSAGNDKSKGVAYNENADKRSWKAFEDFLEQTL